jgi:hypothetical protein
MDIEGVVAQLGTTFSPEEAAIAEKLLRSLHGTSWPWRSTAGANAKTELCWFRLAAKIVRLICQSCGGST